MQGRRPCGLALQSMRPDFHLNQQSLPTVADHVGNPPDGGGDDRHAVGHRLKDRHGNAFVVRWQDQNVADGQQAVAFLAIQPGVHHHIGADFGGTLPQFLDLSVSGEHDAGCRRDVVGNAR